MSFDIYGNRLERGFCEVHPHIRQEYPCELCMHQRDEHYREQAEHDRQMDEERDRHYSRMFADECAAWFDPANPLNAVAALSKPGEAAEQIAREIADKIVDDWIESEKAADPALLNAIAQALTNHAAASEARVRELEAAMNRIVQRSNESGTGESGVINTIYAMNEIARSALGGSK